MKLKSYNIQRKITYHTELYLRNENLLEGDIWKCGSNDVLEIKVVKVGEGTFKICFLTQ